MDYTEKPEIITPIYKNYAIIVAGGSGSRMQSALPKQFLLLNGQAVLMHTIAAFYNCRSAPHIIVVLHGDYHEYWRKLCDELNFKMPHRLVSGGVSRFHSVQNGLALIKDANAVVAIHDAVRPLASAKIIDEAYSFAAQNGNAVVAVKSRDSIRKVEGSHSTALIRDEIFLVQTPQTFQYAVLEQAYQQQYQDYFTDDASVVEQTGVAINIVEGDYSNFKITFPDDIIIAETLLNQKSRN